MNAMNRHLTSIRPVDGGVAALAGLGIPLICTFLMQSLFVWGVPFAYEAAFVLATGAIVVYLSCQYQKPQCRGLLAIIYILLPFGFIIDAAIHLNLHSYTYDHNMLPFEIVYFLILALLPFSLGSFVGRSITEK